MTIPSPTEHSRVIPAKRKQRWAFAVALYFWSCALGGLVGCRSNPLPSATPPPVKWRWIFSWPNPFREPRDTQGMDPGTTVGPIVVHLWTPTHYVSSWLDCYFLDGIKDYREEEFFRRAEADASRSPVYPFLLVLDHPEMAQPQKALEGPVPRARDADSQLIFALKRWYLAADQHELLGSPCPYWSQLGASSEVRLRSAQLHVRRAFSAVIANFPRARLHGALAQIGLGLYAGSESPLDTRSLAELGKARTYSDSEQYWAFLADYYVVQTLYGRGLVREARAKWSSVSRAYPRWRQSEPFVSMDMAFRGEPVRLPGRGTNGVRRG